MKGLRKVLTPFAPDQSGAVSVLYEMGGLIVVVDAGGCTGNICGFDEPRWQMTRSAVFSAGLRDMDAIFGRDDALLKKLKLAVEKLDVSFTALVGTPVPAVIGTDMKALARMAEKKVDLPSIPINCTGLGFYDDGISETYLALLKRFVREDEVKAGTVGIFGLTPLDFPENYRKEVLLPYLRERGYEKVLIFGGEEGIHAFARATQAEKNIVIAPSGLPAAHYMKERFGIPYEVALPGLGERFSDLLEENLTGKKILILHQQVAGVTLRKLLEEKGASVFCASYFRMEEELQKDGDHKLIEEDDFTEEVERGGYDMVIADPCLFPLLKKLKVRTISFSHFALSGKEDHAGS